MITFKEYLEEQNKGNKDILATHLGKKLISTIHSKERTDERNANQDMIKHIFRKAVEHVKANGSKYGKDEHFLVTSKKYNRSAAFHYRPDKFSTSDRSLHFVHTSTFPEGEHYANKNTKKIVVEGIEFNYAIIEVE